MIQTTATAQLLQIAADMGLNPQADDAPYRGTVRVVLSASGQDAGFGVLFVGAKSGKIISANIRHGADDPRPSHLTRRTGYRAARNALIEYGRYATRMGLLPGPEELVRHAGNQMSVTSGRATWVHNIVRVVPLASPSPPC